jgi:hypothetical protein
VLLVRPYLTFQLRPEQELLQDREFPSFSMELLTAYRADSEEREGTVCAKGSPCLLCPWSPFCTVPTEGERDTNIASVSAGVWQLHFPSRTQEKV